MDIGALYDLNEGRRDFYMQNVPPLARPGGRFLLGCSEKKLKLGEIERRFGEQFIIEKVAREPDPHASSRTPRAGRLERIGLCLN